MLHILDPGSRRRDGTLDETFNRHARIRVSSHINLSKIKFLKGSLHNSIFNGAEHKLDVFRI